MDPAINPLLIRTVIHEISKYLTIEECKKYRPVCSQWDKELSDCIRKQVQISLGNDKTLEEFLNFSTYTSSICSNFRIGRDVKLQLDQHFSPSYKFFSLYGKQIKSLHIDDCKWSCDNLKEILYVFCPNISELSVVGSEAQDGFLGSEDGEIRNTRLLKNVKCLRVNLICTSMIRNTKLMAELLRVCPNVETISWIAIERDEIRYDRNFQLDLERAWCARPHEKGITIRDTICDTAIHHRDIELKRLTRIESNMRLNNESIQVLRSRNFPLQFLDISLTADVERCVLKSLLESLSDTLVYLKLEFCYNDVSPGYSRFSDFQFPNMCKVEHLFIQKFSKDFHMCKNFSDKVFPRLKSLTFNETDFKAIVENDNSPCEENSSLNILQITNDLSRYSLSPIDLKLLSSMFPHLLEVRLENCEKIDKDTWKCHFNRLKRIIPPSNVGLGWFPSTRSETGASYRET